MTDEQTRELLHIWLGDPAAVQFCADVIRVADVWDDLIDKDKEVLDEDIHRAFSIALLAIPSNEFYARHRLALLPLVASAIRNWKVATQMERDGNLPEVSFVIRSSYVDLIAACAAIISGPAHGDRIARYARHTVHSEGLEGYKSALAAEAAARGD